MSGIDENYRVSQNTKFFSLRNLKGFTNMYITSSIVNGYFVRILICMVTQCFRLIKMIFIINRLWLYRIQL